MKSRTAMKHISILFALVIALFSSSSCEKSSPETNKATTLGECKNFIFVLEETKAAKTNWGDGDILNIWLSHQPVSSKSPDMRLRRTAGKWAAEVINQECPIGPTGSLVCLYEGYNNLSIYSHSWDNDYEENRFEVPEVNNQMADGYAYATPQIISTNAIDYTYNDGTLSASISGWIYTCPVRFIICNDNSKMTGAPNEYYLQAEYFFTALGRWSYLNNYHGFTMRNNPYSSTPSISSIMNTASKYSVGIQDTDGVAFYFNLGILTNQAIKFTLSGPALGGSTKTYTSGNATIETDRSRCQGFVLKYSSFE